MLGKATPQIVTGSVPGPKAKELLKRRNEAVPKALCGTAYPICMAKGEGAMLEDADGNRFLDWCRGSEYWILPAGGGRIRETAGGEILPWDLQCVCA